MQNMPHWQQTFKTDLINIGTGLGTSGCFVGGPQFQQTVQACNPHLASFDSFLTWWNAEITANGTLRNDVASLFNDCGANPNSFECGQDVGQMIGDCNNASS